MYSFDADPSLSKGLFLLLCFLLSRMSVQRAYPALFNTGIALLSQLEIQTRRVRHPLTARTGEIHYQHQHHVSKLKLTCFMPSYYCPSP
ncbi:hypothetical protein P389DRAFT_10669 [Cystobasidium minutum MCA 4210]|uniref:uncharacterized protein n=1 Tax=Cystobasidium minutum MCA 4210 TaxID=1397322 RepID=UPI0034CEFA95|eukprot:jgi/Rhomi1/10669/CE10668_139